MKHLAYILGATLAAAALFTATSCRTTEANYRNAYNTAIEKQNQPFSAEELQEMAAEEAIPRTLFRGDSIPLKGMYVKTIKSDTTLTPTRKYNVVVARFRQRFNAQSLLNRFSEVGYTNGRLLLDSDQNYYVTPYTTDTLANAIDTWRTLSTTSPLPLRPPFPYILQRP